MSKPALQVVADGAGYDAWFEVTTDAARAQVLVLLQAVSQQQGHDVTERQLAWHLGGVLYQRWGPGHYVLSLNLAANGRYLALHKLGGCDEEGSRS